MVNTANTAKHQQLCDCGHDDTVALAWAQSNAAYVQPQRAANTAVDFWSWSDFQPLPLLSAPLTLRKASQGQPFKTLICHQSSLMAFMLPVPSISTMSSAEGISIQSSIKREQCFITWLLETLYRLILATSAPILQACTNWRSYLSEHHIATNGGRQP